MLNLIANNSLIYFIPPQESGVAFKADKPEIKLTISDVDDPHEYFDNFNLLPEMTEAEFAGNWKVQERFSNTKIGANLNETWRLKQQLTGYISMPRKKSTTEICYQHSAYGKYLPVVPYKEMQLNLLMAAHRCTAYLKVTIYSDSKKIVSVFQSDIPENYMGGDKFESYFNPQLTFKVPEAGHFISISIGSTGYVSDGSNFDSYIFFAGLGLFSNQVGWDMALRASHMDLEFYTKVLNENFKASVINISSTIPMEEDFYISAYCVETEDYIKNTKVKISSIQSFSGSFKNISAAGGVNFTLSGHTRDDQLSIFKTKIRLFIDGKEVQSFVFFLDQKIHEFSTQIEPMLMDGQVHYFALMDEQDAILDQRFEIIENALTSWDVIQQHSMPPYKASMSPLSAFRYQSLQRQLTATMNPETWDQLSFCHEILINGPKTLREYPPLKFLVTKNPKVSVVIPVHNKFELTYFCLCSLLLSYQSNSFEVIVMDDGSCDQTIDIETIVSGIKYVRHDKAKGFVEACNRGAQEASGDFVFFLNNDTEVTAEALDHLVNTFHHFDDIGLVGSKLIYPSGQLQESGGIIWETGDPWNYGRNSNTYDPRYNYCRQVDYLSGAAIMISKQLWDKVDGFSKEFIPAYFEDTDLAFKVRDLGLKTVIVPQSVIVHYEGGSNGTETSSGMKRFQEINRPKFKKKWKSAFKGNGKVGHNPDLAKDRGMVGRALFIDHQFPRFDMDAGSFAAIQEIRCVQSLGYKVTYLPENLAYLGKYVDALEAMGVETTYAPFTLSLKAFLEQRGGEFDVIYITRYYVAKNVLDDIRTYAPHAKILFCNADLHFLREMRAMIADGSEEKREEVEQVMAEEINVMKKVDVVLSYSDVEHAVITSHTMGEATVVKAPWVVDIPNAIPAFHDRKDIAFLGGFGHLPNVEAVEFFLREVWPLVEDKLPGVKFKVYGSQLPVAFDALASKSIEMVGFVEDVADVYNNHRLFVAPLLSGAGMKGKVVSALAYGIPTVMTKVAAEGIGCRHNLDSIIVEKAEDWATAIISLYHDEEKWSGLSSASREYISADYSFEQGVDTMAKAFQSADILAEKNNDALVYNKLLPSP